MIDGLAIVAIFLAAVACVVGLRLTKPVAPVRVSVEEPRQIVSVTRPLALADAPVHVFETPTPDASVVLPSGVLRFLEGL